MASISKHTQPVSLTSLQTKSNQPWTPFLWSSMIYYNTRLLKTAPEKDCLETVITPGRTYQITGCAIFFAVITGKLEGRFFCGGGRLSHKKCVARPHQTRLLCLWKHQPDRPIQMNETRSVPLLSLLAWFQWAKAKTRLSGGCGYGKKKK